VLATVVAKSLESTNVTHDMPTWPKLDWTLPLVPSFSSGRRVRANQKGLVPPLSALLLHTVRCWTSSPRCFRNLICRGGCCSHVVASSFVLSHRLLAMAREIPLREGGVSPCRPTHAPDTQFFVGYDARAQGHGASSKPLRHQRPASSETWQPRPMKLIGNYERTVGLAP
jgi:hypothetical protein